MEVQVHLVGYADRVDNNSAQHVPPRSSSTASRAHRPKQRRCRTSEPTGREVLHKAAKANCPPSIVQHGEALSSIYEALEKALERAMPAATSYQTVGEAMRDFGDHHRVGRRWNEGEHQGGTRLWQGRHHASEGSKLRPHRIECGRSRSGRRGEQRASGPERRGAADIAERSRCTRARESVAPWTSASLFGGLRSVGASDVEGAMQHRLHFEQCGVARRRNMGHTGGYASIIGLSCRLRRAHRAQAAL